MFNNLLDKVSAFGLHHQLLFALVVGLSIICISWSVEKILENYVFPEKKLRDCLLAILVGLGILWITQHYILHVL